MLAEFLFHFAANQALFFEVPLAVQWEQLNIKIKSSMMIFDETNRVAYAAFWCNIFILILFRAFEFMQYPGKNYHLNLFISIKSRNIILLILKIKLNNEYFFQ